MHLVKDENGNLCAHTHDHAHPHTHEGGLEHSHAHSHEHGHEQDHHHDHSHMAEEPCQKDDCSGCQGCGQEGTDASKNTALLTYMYQHNQSHAAELDQMAAKLQQEGMEKAAEQIRRAVDEFQKGNMYLNLALSMVKEGQQEG